jgi:hypothetical protein
MALTKSGRTAPFDFSHTQLDITADLASALAPHPLLLQGLVNGRDQLVPADELKSELAPVYDAYRGAAPSALSIRPGEDGARFADWLINHL